MAISEKKVTHVPMAGTKHFYLYLSNVETEVPSNAGNLIRFVTEV